LPRHPRCPLHHNWPLPPWNCCSSASISHDAHFGTMHQSDAGACPMAEAHYNSNSQYLILEKLCRENDVGPTYGFMASPEEGPGGHCQYPADRVLTVLKPNRIIHECTDANCSSFHLRVFLGLSNPQGKGQTSSISIPCDNFGERKPKFNLETSRTTQMHLYKCKHVH
jgi:hypothetical protein